MAEKWFYTHNGQTLGPFSIDEIRHRAAAGLLQADDRLWPENADRQRAVTAGAALDFAGLVRESTSAPDWLADVQALEQASGQSPATAPRPDWLEDVDRLSLGPAPRERGTGHCFLSFLIRAVRRWFPAGSKTSPTAP
jgi:hypothetical protein